MSQRDLNKGAGALFRDEGQDGLLHRAFLRGEGFTEEEVRRSPVIGIANSASELNPCNAGLNELAELVKEGIREAGGLPLEFPTISISEPFTRPTSLYLRNLMSMDVEEMIGATPIDGVVLLGGCDKTIPAQIMGALSANKPAVLLAAGPRPVSCFKKNKEFTVDDVWPLCEDRRVGAVSDEDWLALEGKVNVGVGTCNVMGTATTMAAIAEMLGFALPGSTLPAANSPERAELARATGRQIVQSVAAELLPADLVTDESLENAFRVVSALGGSTNAVIHLEAIAGRAGLRIGPERFESWSASTPYVANVRPSGQRLLADLDDAGGVPAIVQRIGETIHGGVVTANGNTWDQVLADQEFPVNDAIAPAGEPLSERGALVMLRGNLAPRGAVLKAAGVHDPKLKAHRGRAVVFDGIDDLNTRIDDPDLDVDQDSVLVLRGMGVLGAPGMPEVGHIPIPAKLHRAGIRDMVRLSDARMSGTSTGTVVVHITPEAAAGGPLGILATGDEIELDAAAGTLRHFLSEEEISSRVPFAAPPIPTRGMGWLHQRHALQADDGCDFDFLRATGVQ
ncbi:dihydroxy-acid dehydratase [Paeniglutamicibacter gangotriensis]|uniref:Dihydroxy-acid dehydratase n=1 Tax=Paeniglutamicibacter gangotriensis Lz1y TaxID=1276920 RepID=M7N6K0_9MICC|nr:dihydroxy-acid dehydratase [Paeniglutamicibacter gangotriensis]EMQ97389.1 dihydroxy-acid dehydratase [Paeniglutamicibacter gangotriensis Lz1y]